MLPQIIVTNQQKLVDLAQSHDISFLGLYGSYARGQENDQSDMDLLVDFEQSKGLLEIAFIEGEFEKVLGAKVDLVTRQGLSKYVKPYIQDDLTVIYAKKS